MHIRTITRKDGTKSYRAIIKTGGKELGKTFAKKLHAKQWATRIEHDAGLSVALGCQGVTTTFGKLVKDFESADRSEWPVLPENQVQFWIDHIGPKTKLIEIRKSNVRAGVDKKRATQGRKGLPVTASTLNNYLATMRTLWRFASNKYDSISREFISDLKPRRVNNARKRYLTKDERADLLTACKAAKWDRLHLLVVMALTTGARKSEMMNLRWSDVDLESGTAYLTKTKNGDSRNLIIPAVTLEKLKAIREVGNGYLFPDASGTQPFYFRKQWLRAVAEAGIEDFKFHDLRHSAASYLLEAGHSLEKIGEILGHRSQQSTKRYAHGTDEDMQSVSNGTFNQIDFG